MKRYSMVLAVSAVLFILAAFARHSAVVPAHAGPGAGFMMMNMLDERIDPYDLFFNVNIHRFITPGDWFVLPRQQTLVEGDAKLAETMRGVRTMEISLRRRGASPEKRSPMGGLPFDIFYSFRRAVCEFDRDGLLVSARMYDESGPAIPFVRRRVEYDGSKRPSFERIEMFRQSIRSYDDPEKRLKCEFPAGDAATAELELCANLRYFYDAAGRLSTVEAETPRFSITFSHSYNAAGKCLYTACYEFSLDASPCFAYRYRRDAAGRIAQVQWNRYGKWPHEQYYNYEHDTAGNLITARCTPYHAPPDSDTIENTFKYDAAGRLCESVFYNWKKWEDGPDAVAKCQYRPDGRLGTIEVIASKFVHEPMTYELIYTYGLY